MPNANQTDGSITIDFREKRSGIVELLQKYGVKTLLTSLSYGDFIINNTIVIERKTAGDFLMSLINERLFRQIANMKNTRHRPLLLIEGNPFKTGLNISREAIKGALLSICAMWYLPIVFSKNLLDTASLLSTIYYQENKNVRVVKLRQSNRRKRLRSEQLYILQSLPHVGPVMANRLFEHFKTVNNVFQAPVEQLTKIKGLGKKADTDIRRVLDFPAVQQ